MLCNISFYVKVAIKHHLLIERKKKKNLIEDVLTTHAIIDQLVKLVPIFLLLFRSHCNSFLLE